MAGPGGREVARASVRILPDTSSFASSLQAYLERTERRMRINLPVSLDQGDVAKTEAQLDALTRDRDIELNVDTDRLVRNMESATSIGIGRFGRLAGIIGLVTFAVAALTGALPAALALLGAPVLAAVAGWDGIKNAASGLTDEVDRLRESVSATFERLMTPGFERLARIFPTVQDGLNGVAEGVSEIFDAFTHSITSDKALGQLDSIFDNVQKFLEKMTPAVDPFVDSLLKLADAGTKASVSLTPEFVATFDHFADRLEELSQNGDLQKGMEGIGHAIAFIAFWMGEFVLNSITFIAWLERLGEKIEVFVNKTVPEGWAAIKSQTQSDWESIRTTISDKWDQIGRDTYNGVVDMARDIGRAWDDLREAARRKWQQIVDAIQSKVSDLPGELEKAGRDAATGFGNGIGDVLDGVVGWVQEKIDAIIDAFQSALALGSPSRLLRQYGAWAGEGFQLGLEDAFDGVEDAALALAAAPITATSAVNLLPTAGSDNRGLTRADLDYLAARIAALMGISTSSALAAESAFASTMGRMR